MTLFEWMAELKYLAYVAGCEDLVGIYHHHVASYKAGKTPPDELKRLMEKEEGK